MFLRIFYKPERRPHPKAIFQIVEVEDGTTHLDLTRRFRAEGRCDLLCVITTASIEADKRVILGRRSRTFDAADIESVCRINITLIERQPTARETELAVRHE